MQEILLDNFTLFKRLYGQMTERVCRRYGINRMELDVLLFLANFPEHDTAAELVVRRGLTKSHVSAAVASLERRGFLRRRRLPGDRREMHLSLCPAAEPVALDGQAAQAAFRDVLCRGFTPEELAGMERNLGRMSDNVRAALAEGGTC